MPFVDVNRVRINYLQIPHREGTGEDLVLVHGLATSMAFWYFSHAQAFSQRYRVTLYDLRGHGRSSVPEAGYDVGTMALDLKQLLDETGIERAHFAGHSFGGAVALNLACRNPERFSSLMLFDTHLYAVRFRPGTTWRNREKIQRILNENDLAIDVQDPFFGHKLLCEVARLKVTCRSITGELDELVRPVLGKNSMRTAARWLNLLDTTQAGQEFTRDDGILLEALRTLSFPILAAYGEYSQALATGELLLDVWPHADFRRIRDAGHFFPVTRPALFTETYRQFWNGALVDGVRRRQAGPNRNYFRSDRFYHREGAWYFDTRESLRNGPFQELQHAEAAFASSPLRRRRTTDAGCGIEARPAAGPVGIEP